MSSKKAKTPEPLGKEERYFDEFPAPSNEEWKAEVVRLLRGAPYEKKMLTKTHEGITLQPIYRKEDVDGIPHLDGMPGFAPFVRGRDSWPGETSWEIAQEIDCKTAEEFNANVRHDLERGLTAIVLPLDEASRQGLDPDYANPEDVGKGGVSVATLQGLKTALNGVNLEEVPVYIQTGASGMPYLGLYVALARQAGIDPAKLKGAIAMDPVGEMVGSGVLRQSLNWAYVSMAEMTCWTRDHAPGIGTIWVHGEPLNDGGANAVQELAYVLSVAVEYLRAMENRGLKLEDVLPHMRFSFALGANFFMEVAKLRAARLLWNRILESSDVAEEKRGMWIHARTSRYTKTLYDPYVNMLRDTTEAFSGIVGGTNSMHVAPFDEPIRSSDEFSRRIAQNTQIVLKEEANLFRILDPGGGSWYIESLTNEVAEAAWKEFQAIEEQGGVIEALQKGTIQEQVAKTAENRIKALGTRKNVIVGTNQYPNPTETLLESRDIDQGKLYTDRSRELKELRTSSDHQSQITVLNKLSALLEADDETIAEAVIDVAGHGATVGEIVKIRVKDAGDPLEITPIPSLRAAMPFENLRKAVENFRTAKGGAKVFLTTLGQAGRYMPRLDFAASFFEVGGFEVVRTMGHESPDEAAKATLDSAAEVAVICGLDTAYESDAANVASKIKAGNPDTTVILAGMPKDEGLVKSLKDSGVDQFIHVRSDVLEILTGLAGKLGVEL